MNRNEGLGIVILLSLITIALFGGIDSVGRNSYQNNPNQSIQNQLDQAQKDTEELKKKIQQEEDKKNQSEYFGMVDISYVSRGIDTKDEYIVIKSNNLKNPINITGWTIRSRSTGNSVTIPKASYLFFADTNNTEDNIFLNSYETVYLTTGFSPNGASFKVNKCSGYLTQFQNFYPNLYTSCPLPRNENLSSIPKSPNNDACLDYIDYFPGCRIQTESLPANWSYECTNFIYSKINYPSCVNTHRKDKDFYQSEWRVFLKRSERLWKDRRESLILTDLQGKVVDTLEY